MLVMSRQFHLLTGLAGVVVWVGAATGQSQPLPLPSPPGAAPPPIYSQPSPTTPTVTVPESYPREMQRAVPPRAPVATPSGKGGDATGAPRQRVPQITSFPELTRGIGNSETLLQE